jgi:hypothetical protein
MEKACKTGNLTAIRNLARFYEEGIGCQVDMARAIEYYQKAGDRVLHTSHQAIPRQSCLRSGHLL